MPGRLIALGLSVGLLAVAALAFALTRDDADDGAGDRPSALVWAVGDGGDGSATAKAVAARIRADDPDRVLYLGDVYERGTAEEFRENFATVYGARRATTRSGARRRGAPCPISTRSTSPAGASSASTARTRRTRSSSRSCAASCSTPRAPA